jgi:hypothetical protein
MQFDDPDPFCNFSSFSHLDLPATEKEPPKMDSRFYHRRGISKTYSYGGNIASTRSSFAAIQNRILAYELGSISRTNIEKEASKMSPRLHRLVGHATIFDSAAKYIREHIDDRHSEPVRMEEAVVEDDFEDDHISDCHLGSSRDHEEIRNQESFAITHVASFNSFAEVKVKESCAVVVTSKSFDPDDDASTDSSDDYDQISPQSWDDSNPMNDTCKIQSEWEFMDSNTKQLVCLSSNRNAQEEDTLLWSQQPKVLSTKQAQTLLFDAFG